MRVAGSVIGFPLALVVIGGSFPLGAQRPGSVRGVVVDSVTRAPLAQVLVTITGRPHSDMTDDQGVYRIDAVAPGQVRITARKLGFHPITTASHTVDPGAVITVHLKLARVALDLDPVEVSVERVRRAAIGARVFRGEELPRGDILAALQSTVPSLRTSGRRDDTRVRLRQSSSEVLYWIDGVVITPPLVFLIDTRDVECVEVRAGYRAAQEFRPSINSEAYSGVVLIWMRGSRQPKPQECGR